MTEHQNRRRRIPRLPDHIKEIAGPALLELSKTQRAPGIGTFGQPDMGSFAINAVVAERLPEEPIVVTVSGKPGVGKTNRTTLLRDFLQLGQVTNEITWEGAERAVIENGQVGVKDEPRQRRKKPITIIERRTSSWSEQALNLAEDELSKQIENEIKRNRWCVVGEIPARAIEITGRWIGKSLGTRMLDRLLGKTGEFDGHYTPMPAAIIAGVALTEFSKRYREEKKAADTFVKGIRVQSLYGQPLPQTPDEWIRMREEGASLEQMKNIDKTDDQVYEALEQQGLIPQPPQEEVDNLFNIWECKNTEQNGYDMEEARNLFNRALKDAQRYVWFFSKYGKHKDGFIGYNNPSLVDLTRDETKAENLRKRWKNGTKMIPLKKDTWHTLS